MSRFVRRNFCIFVLLSTACGPDKPTVEDPVPGYSQAEISEPSTGIPQTPGIKDSENDNWTVINDAIINEINEPGRNILIIADNKTVEVRGAVRAAMVVVFADDITIADGAFIDVSIKGPHSPLQALAEIPEPGRSGQDGASGADGQQGGEITLILKSTERLNAALSEREKSNFANPLFILDGQDGQDGQNGQNGNPGGNSDSVDPGQRDVTVYSNSWNAGNFGQGLEAARGNQGQSGGNGGNGGNSGNGGLPGKLRIYAESGPLSPKTLLAEAEKKISTQADNKPVAEVVREEVLWKAVRAIPGTPGKQGSKGIGADGGLGTQGFLFNVRHCRENKIVIRVSTECETHNAEGRGYAGHRGVHGADGADGVTRPSVPVEPGAHLIFSAPAEARSEEKGERELVYRTEAAQVLEHFLALTVNLSGRGHPMEAELMASRGIRFHDEFKPAQKTDGVLDEMVFDDLLAARDALRSGLGALGEPRTPLRYVPSRPYAELLAFEAPVMDNIRHLRDDLINLESAQEQRLDAGKALPLLREQSIRQIEEMARLKRAAQEQRDLLEQSLRVLSQEQSNFDSIVEAWHERVTREASDELSKEVATANKKLWITGAATIAAAAITFGSGAAAGAMVAGLVVKTGEFWSRSVGDEDILRFGDAKDMVDIYKQYRADTSEEEIKKRGDKLDAIDKAKGLKRLSKWLEFRASLAKKYNEPLSNILKAANEEWSKGQSSLNKQTESVKDPTVREAMERLLARAGDVMKASLTLRALDTEMEEQYRVFKTLQITIDELEELTRSSSGAAYLSPAIYSLRRTLLLKSGIVADYFRNAKKYEAAERILLEDPFHLVSSVLFDTQLAADFVNGVLERTQPKQSMANALRSSHAYALSEEEQRQLLKHGHLQIFLAPRNRGFAKKVFSVAVDMEASGSFMVVKDRRQVLETRTRELAHYSMDPVAFGVLSSHYRRHELVDTTHPSLLGWWDVYLLDSAGGADGHSVAISELVFDFTWYQ